MMNEKELYNRFTRQIILNDWGIAGQKKLLRSKVLIVGMGGLGCPALQFLTAAGLRQIGVIDYDTVELNNLHRQILFNDKDIGFNKAIKVVEKMKDTYPQGQFQAFPSLLTVKNGPDLIQRYDYIMDCTDRFSTRYLLSDLCLALKKTLIMGALSQYEGTVCVFDHFNEKKSVCSYRDIFPQPPEVGEVKTCNQAGVLSTLSGTVGILMAHELLKCMIPIHPTLHNQMAYINLLDFQVHKMTIKQNPQGTGIQSIEDIKENNYNFDCDNDMEIDAKELKKLMGKDAELKLIDVRERGEKPVLNQYACQQIPLSVLKEKPLKKKSKNIVFFCQTGLRSMEAVKMHQHLLSLGSNIYSLKNGITTLM